MSIIILLFTQNALSASLCFGVFFECVVVCFVCVVGGLFIFFPLPWSEKLKATAVHDWLTCLSFVVLERNVNDPYVCGLNFST